MTDLLFSNVAIRIAICRIRQSAFDRSRFSRFYPKSALTNPSTGERKFLCNGIQLNMNISPDVNMVSRKHKLLSAGLCAVVAAGVLLCLAPLSDSKPVTSKAVGSQVTRTEHKKTLPKDTSIVRLSPDEAQHHQFDSLLDREHKASHELMDLGMSAEDHNQLHKELDAKHAAYHARLKQAKSVRTIKRSNHSD